VTNLVVPSGAARVRLDHHYAISVAGEASSLSVIS
jgi:hypothetical protein